MGNIAEHIREMAAKQPEKQALLIRKEQGAFASMTFAELEQRSNQLAWGLSNAGMRQGMKVAIFARPSLELYALLFAVMKLGGIPVMIPQWRGWSHALTCIMQCAPGAFIGTASTFLMKVFFGRAFSTVNVNIMIGGFQLFGGIPSGKLKTRQEEYPIHDFGENETEALLFTAGSTGAPKGVALTYGMLERRLEALNELFPKQGTAPDLSCALPCTLLELCLGRTVIVEDGDADVLFNAICAGTPEYAFAYSSAWHKMYDLCKNQQCRLNGLKTAVILGPPAISSLGRDLTICALDEEACAMQTYGTAETGLVSAINCRDMLKLLMQKDNLGKGLPLGAPCKGVGLRIIEAKDGVGEICVESGTFPVSYVNRPEETEMSGCAQDGTNWLRTGDLGFLDNDGTLWHCGRKAFLVETAAGMTLHSSCCEELVNLFPGVRRSLLVGLGEKPSQIPVLIVEPEPDAYDKLADNKEGLLSHIAAFPQTAGIRHLLFKHELADDAQRDTQWAAERI